MWRIVIGADLLLSKACLRKRHRPSRSQLMTMGKNRLCWPPNTGGRILLCVFRTILIASDFTRIAKIHLLFSALDASSSHCHDDEAIR